MAPDAGITGAAAMGKAGQLMGIMGLATLLWMPVFGFLLDRISRVTGMALAMLLAGLGYTSMGLIDSPLNMANVPFFVLLAIGQGSAIVASVTLVGQEAPASQRGSIVSTSAMFGAVGILVASLLGGRLFDSIGPSAPFVMTGLFQFVLFAIAVAVRLMEPKQPSP
jgi:MFS family permease